MFLSQSNVIAITDNKGNVYLINIDSGMVILTIPPSMLDGSAGLKPIWGKFFCSNSGSR